MPWGNIDLNQESHQDAIESRLGVFSSWNAVWDSGNWIWLTASLPRVFSQEIFQTDEEPASTPVDFQNDGDHILLFPQDAEGLCPRAWFIAAWPFLESFRSNFSFFSMEAFMYKKVTLIGHPRGNRLGISFAVEEELKKADWRNVERIWCTNKAELELVLQTRIEENVRFRGYDELKT